VRGLKKFEKSKRENGEFEIEESKKKKMIK
jgi:hypothetical protein